MATATAVVVMLAAQTTINFKRVTASAAAVAAMATAMVRATSMATSMKTPAATLMAIAAAEIEAVAATEKLVAKAGGNYKAAAKRHRHQSTKKDDGDGNRTGAVKVTVKATVTVGGSGCGGCGGSGGNNGSGDGGGDCCKRRWL